MIPPPRRSFSSDISACQPLIATKRHTECEPYQCRTQRKQKYLRQFCSIQRWSLPKSMQKMLHKKCRR
ncbi:hypothetical protein OSTOST_08935 [Ostertagia ostertagi]